MRRVQDHDAAGDGRRNAAAGSSSPALTNRRSRRGRFWRRSATATRSTASRRKTAARSDGAAASRLPAAFETRGRGQSVRAIVDVCREPFAGAPRQSEISASHFSRHVPVSVAAARASTTPTPGDYIETTLDDIAIANELATDLFGQSLGELSRPSRELLKLIRRMMDELQQKKLPRSSSAGGKSGSLPGGAITKSKSMSSNWKTWNTSCRSVADADNASRIGWPGTARDRTANGSFWG